MNKNEIITPVLNHDYKAVKMVRVCGRCQTILTKENTGELMWLQPDCNDCTQKHESSCRHTWKEVDSSPKLISILCGIVEIK